MLVYLVQALPLAPDGPLHCVMQCRWPLWSQRTVWETQNSYIAHLYYFSQLPVVAKFAMHVFQGKGVARICTLTPIET